MFFAEHYANNWMETWNFKWYTGFTMTSYPPLIHHLIAIVSKLIGLKGAFISVAICSIMLFVRGVYQFSKIWVSETVAGYACLLAVVSSSYIEAIHLFGQLPSVTGMALLLNACPELYKWIVKDKWTSFLKGISIIACVTAAHHVTTIFGMVFFIAPVLGVAVLDRVIKKEEGIQNVRVKHFIAECWKLKWRAILVGISIIAITIIIIFPYWYWSKTDPITQVSIPHGSRANFIAEPNMGLVFFLIPWGIMLFFLPPIFQRVFIKRNLFLGLSFSLLFLLGTGGTTPLPKMMLGDNAFNILTLDRFTFWATIIAIPFFASLMHSLIEGPFKQFLRRYLGKIGHVFIIIFVFIGMIMIDAFTINMTNLKPMQPSPIDVKPIANFLERDGHDEWRYLTLGFGDQMAWLGANTHALCVDGNYHSARRLPEMTTRAVERIENSKYLGEEGLGALRQFLTLPEKFNLKYIFNNDKFYESVLYFYGWTKLRPLENGIDVWERKDVPKLPSVLPQKKIPDWQTNMWFTLPLFSLIFALLINLFLWQKTRFDVSHVKTKTGLLGYLVYLLWFLFILSIVIIWTLQVRQEKDVQSDPIVLIKEYFHNLDFNYTDKAFDLLYKDNGYTRDQFLLERSLEDGLLASYAKLDSVEIINTGTSNANEKIISARTHWFTAVQKFTKNHKITVKKSNGQWFIIKDPFPLDIPKDQFLRIPQVEFLNQGRRQALAGKTNKEDILDRPEIYIDQASLVKKDSNYYVIGELINLDIDPAFVNVKCILYDEQGNKAIEYNTNQSISHNLLPKERTNFRIELKDVLIQSELNLDTINLSSLSLFANSIVTDEKIYRYYGIKDIKIISDSLSGNVINYGNKDIIIPQLNVAYYDEKQLKWVEPSYLDNGIRPQRELNFKSTLIEASTIKEILKAKPSNILINGIPKNEINYKQKRLNPTIRYNQSDLIISVNAFTNVN